MSIVLRFHIARTERGALRKSEQRQTGGGVVRSERSHFKRSQRRVTVATT